MQLPQLHEQRAYELVIPHKDQIHRVLNIGFVNLPEVSIRITEALGITPEFTHLEIFESNALRGQQQRPDHKIIHGDVRKILDLDLGTFDLIVWWHGPEHIYEHELVQALQDIETLLTPNGAVILGSPDGWQEQHDLDGNVHNDHLSGPDTAFYTSLGYASYAVDVPPMSLVAYKTKS